MFRIFANALDQITTGVDHIGNEAGIDGVTFIGIVQNVVSIILFIAGIIAVGIIIYGGIQYMMSAGNASKIERAKVTITWAVIGLLICIVSYAVVRFVIHNTTQDQPVSTPDLTPGNTTTPDLTPGNQPEPDLTPGD